MKIPTDHDYDNDFIAPDDQVTNAVNKFRNHPIIIMMKNEKKYDQSFSFGPVPYDDVLKKVKTLDTTKASQQSNIPTKTLKQNSDYFAEYFNKNINQCISKSIFPSDLKLADVTPVYNKKPKNSKDNYRPISLLFNISKIYERCIYDQIHLFFDSLLSKYQCGFRRGYNTQHCLITLIKKWKKRIDNGGEFGALLTDLQKAFDYLPHELLKKFFKKDVYNAKIKNIEDKIPDNLATNASLNAKVNKVKGEIPNITNLTTDASLNAKITEVKGEIANITNLASTTAFTTVENKIPSVTNLVKKIDCNKNISEIEKKITDHNHDKCSATPEFNKFSAEIFDLRIKRTNLASKSDIANFVNKTDFDNKLKDVTSNKNEYNELNELSKKLKQYQQKD